MLNIMKLSFETMGDIFNSLSYVYVAFEIITRILNIEFKMKAGNIYGVLDNIQNDDVLYKNNMRKRVYTKICITVLLTVLPFIIEFLYNRCTGKSINPMMGLCLLVILNFGVPLVYEVDLTAEELEFADNKK